MPSSSDRDPDGELPQHPLVDQLKSDPAKPARKFIVLVGLPGKSDRADQQRLYLTAKLDYFAEFPTSAILTADKVPADQSPIRGHEATRVTIARDATIHYTWASTAEAMDEFDLDVRLGAPGRAAAAVGLATRVATCFPDGTQCGTCNGTCDTCRPQQTCFTCDTCLTRCGQATCVTCQTRCAQFTCAPTCQTCQTQCGQATCANTCVATCQTCQTQCQQATCQTCPTQCNQQTCHTCQTRCGQDTCFTCRTCDTCHTCFTCHFPHCTPPQ